MTRAWIFVTKDKDQKMNEKILILYFPPMILHLEMKEPEAQAC